jgi:tetratricopeptide (TPR) repeat protein
MSDEDDGRPARGGNNVNALLAATLGTVSDNPRVDELLDRQIALSDLQIDNLRKEDEFEVSHLRWRRFNDQMKGAMQIMLVAVGALIVIGIAAALWNASQADGLVVDAFSVPPSFAAAGMGGDVVAGDVTAKIAAIRDVANTHSLKQAKDVQANRNEDVKVEIPDTGVSVAQAWRYLKSWLGHERHMGGNLRTLANGHIALAVTLDGDDAIVREGAPGDLDRLEQQSAEQVFSSVDPINYVLYLYDSGRGREAYAAAARNVTTAKDAPDQADAYSVWAEVTAMTTNEAALAVERGRIAQAIDPRAVLPHVGIMRFSSILGHDEEVLRQANLIPTFQSGDDPSLLRGRGFAAVQAEALRDRDAELGDYAAAAAVPCDYCTVSMLAMHNAGYAAQAHDVAQSRALIAQSAAAGSTPLTFEYPARYQTDAAAQDWSAALADARAFRAAAQVHRDGFAALVRLPYFYDKAQIEPRIALALAHLGDIAAARSTIATTSPTCYDCLRVRGNIETLAKNWNGAAQWFAQAVRHAPSIPFAYADWGAMLLAKGDTDGAIAKFVIANQKGPHFADPLEMWGEALIARNRSDLALAKFAEAAKYAPHWGRLHLKWGEALYWSGDKDGAKKQFAIAAGLDMTPSEKSELARMHV